LETNNKTTANSGLAKVAAEVLNSTAVLRLNLCAKLKICASISATSPSRRTLAGIVTDTLQTSKDI